MLSKLIITPLIFLHKHIANSDFPEAVGPAITIIGLELFILISNPYIINFYLTLELCKIKFLYDLLIIMRNLEKTLSLHLPSFPHQLE